MLKLLEFKQGVFLRILQKRVHLSLFGLSPPRLLFYFANVSLIYVLFLGQ